MRLIPQVMRDMAALYRAIKLKAGTISSGISIPDQPAFDPEFAAFFREKIKKADFYLEFGSGGSTVLAAQARVLSICIENDKAFADAVRSAIGHSPHVTVIHGDIGLTEEWGYPVFKSGTEYRYARWRNYTEKAFGAVTEKSQYPDMILIDGRFRVACALACAYHSTQAGQQSTIYIDDYAERPHYWQVEHWLGKPAMIGRVAGFVVNGQDSIQNIRESDIRLAHQDYR